MNEQDDSVDPEANILLDHEGEDDPQYSAQYSEGPTHAG
jgi:hypothetical protein